MITNFLERNVTCYYVKRSRSSVQCKQGTKATCRVEVYEIQVKTSGRDFHAAQHNSSIHTSTKYATIIMKVEKIRKA